MRRGGKELASTPESSSTSGSTAVTKLCHPVGVPGLQLRADGNVDTMTDKEDRERESQLTDENKFEEMTDETAEEQQRIAARLANDPLVNEPGRDED